MNATLAIVLSLAAIGAPLGAQGGVAGRWSVHIVGEVTQDRGDLRFDGAGGGRLLLASADQRWLPVSDLQREGAAVQFRIDGRGLFVGELHGEWLRGRLHDPELPPVQFDAQRIQPGTERWPVPPRIRMRELVVGSGARSSRFADAWRARILPRETLIAEHARLAATVGAPPANITDIVRRAQGIVLGERPEGVTLARRALEQIAKTPAADRRFQTLFGGPARWRLDIHAVAWQLAAERVGAGPLQADRMLANLIASGILPTGTTDTAQMRRAVWELARRDQELHAAGNELQLTGSPTDLLAIRAVIAAYGEARRWWTDAVDWLLQHAWIETADGYRSPVDLVREFWRDSSLTLPALAPTDFGGMQAVPVIGIGRLDSTVVTPVNAVAAEWLTQGGGPDAAFAAWRTIDSMTTVPLPVVVGDASIFLHDPADVVANKLGGFIAASDRILIDPTILPVFAIGTVVHEWQHLRFSAARLRGREPLGWHSTPWGVRMSDGDPWLVEGAAEWATEELFRPANAAFPLFSFVEAEKRLALGADRPDDTHVLGYLLVRAIAARLDSPDLTRRLLVANLDHPEGLAAAAGLGGGSSTTLDRPNTLMVIPEITFAVDGGVAIDITRRLLVPQLSPELD